MLESFAEMDLMVYKVNLRINDVLPAGRLGAADLHCVYITQRCRFKLLLTPAFSNTLMHNQTCGQETDPVSALSHPERFGLNAMPPSSSSSSSS